MWKPRRLTTPWASTACYRDSSTFFTFSLTSHLPCFTFYVLSTSWLINSAIRDWKRYPEAPSQFKPRPLPCTSLSTRYSLVILQLRERLICKLWINKKVMLGSGVQTDPCECCTQHTRCITAASFSAFTVVSSCVPRLINSNWRLASALHKRVTTFQRCFKYRGVNTRQYCHFLTNSLRETAIFASISSVMLVRNRLGGLPNRFSWNLEVDNCAYSLDFLLQSGNINRRFPWRQVRRSCCRVECNSINVYRMKKKILRKEFVEKKWKTSWPIQSSSEFLRSLDESGVSYVITACPNCAVSYVKDHFAQTPPHKTHKYPLGPNTDLVILKKNVRNVQLRSKRLN
jgi:hypothetical protein